MAKYYVAVFKAPDDWTPARNTIKDSCNAVGIVRGVEIKKLQAEKLIEVSPEVLNNLTNGNG